MSSYLLKLYVAGGSPATDEVVATVRRIYELYLPPDSELLVINVQDSPEVAARDKVLAIPTLIREHPLPVRRLVGDLTDVRVVLKALELES